MLFPTTLKSGRPAQQNTVSQQIFYSNRRNAEELAKQRAIDREYVQRMKEAEAGKGVDRRFFTRVEDYTQIADPDPYAGVFGESKSTQKLRVAAWQRQFEKENEDVELPYERTSRLSRLAPNWFVRMLVNVRDQGGFNHPYYLALAMSIAAFMVILLTHMTHTKPSESRPMSEVR